MKKIIVSLFLMAAYQVGFAGGFESYSGYYCEYYSTGNQCYIVGDANYYNNNTVVNIPGVVQNTDEGGLSPVRTVTQLGNGATILNNQTVLFGVSTPSSIQSINSYAFASLQNLTTVVINGSPDIQSNAFSNDPNLTDVYPPLSGDIGDSAFEGCVKLRNIGLKEGVTKIGKRAFANCKSLRTLTIPKTVVSIAPDAFDGSGIKSVVLERGNAPIKFSKGIYVTVRQQPYPKK
jgi:BspA type Leucine rich repeat region (6 copies)